MTLCFDHETNVRLAVYAAMVGLDRSAAVEKLILPHLRRFVVSDRGGPDTGEFRQDGSVA